MKKVLIALLAVATISWYAQPASAEYRRGHGARHDSGHRGGGYHHRGHHGHHGYRHGHHRPHHGHYYRSYHRPRYVPNCYRPYVYKPYSGFQLHGHRGSFGLWW